MIDWVVDRWDDLTWWLWRKWRWKWQHRKDTLEEMRHELYLRWEQYLETVKDVPATRDLHDAIDGMQDLKQQFGDEDEGPKEQT
jgi:hypothetical protein